MTAVSARILVLFAIAFSCLLPNGASAQAPGLTQAALIGDAVSEADSPKYGDVGEAIKRFNNRDQLGAQQFLEAARRKDEKLPPVGLLIAKMYLLSGQGPAARAALEKAVMEDAGDDPEPYLLLAEDAVSTGRIIEGDALFDKAVKEIAAYAKNPKRKRQFEIRAYRGRAAVSQRRRKWDQAAADLKKLVELDPENAEAHRQLGMVSFWLNDAKGGYQNFVTAKKLNPKLPSPYVQAGVMYDALAKSAESLKSFEAAYAENKTDETTLVAYANALVRSGDLAKAETILKQAQAAAPSSLNVWLLSGVTARMMNKPDVAEQALSRALTISPTNTDVLGQLAQLLIGNEDEAKKNRARECAIANQRLNENSSDANITLAWVLFNAGDLQNASQALQNGLRAGTLSPDSSVLVAKILLERDDKTNARNLLENALKNDQGIFVMREEATAMLAKLK